MSAAPRLVMIVAALLLTASASPASPASRSAASPAPYIEQLVVAHFPGQIPFAQWQVIWTVSHYEGETVGRYTLGGSGASNWAGNVTAVAGMDELAQGYSNAWGGDAPIYEVQACLYPAFVFVGVPLACTSAFIGHYPEPLFYYHGGTP